MQRRVKTQEIALIREHSTIVAFIVKATIF